MGCQKIKDVQSLRYSGYLTNTSCVCQEALISMKSNDKQKSFIPKKDGMLIFKTLKNKKSDFLNFNTCFCLRLYSMYGFFENMYCFGMKILGYSNIMTQHFSKGRWSWLRWRQNSLWVDLQLNVQKDVLKCFITDSTIMLQSKLSFICN